MGFNHLTWGYDDTEKTSEKTIYIPMISPLDRSANKNHPPMMINDGLAGGLTGLFSG
jgi:hypothetical protein